MQYTQCHSFESVGHTQRPAIQQYLSFYVPDNLHRFCNCTAMWSLYPEVLYTLCVWCHLSCIAHRASSALMRHLMLLLEHMLTQLMNPALSA